MDNFRQQRMVKTFWIFILGFALLFIRLYFIQVRSNPDLAAKAKAQQNKIVGLEEVPRGDIFDRYRVPLTGEASVTALVIFPDVLKDKELAVQELSRILWLPPNYLAEKMSGGPVAIPMNFSQYQINQIKREAIPGIQVYDYKRRYAPDQLAVHLIGHLGKISVGELNQLNSLGRRYRNTDLVGKMGLEKYYDRYLKGAEYEDYAALPVDARNRPLKGLGIFRTEEKDDQRHHLVLTIDRRIQAVVEQVMQENNIAAGAVAVMDVATGDILAMASRPAFDPNDVSESLTADNQGRVFLDNNLQLVQPGSVFKPVIAAAALELGIIKARSRYLCMGENDELIRCYREEGHGILNFEEAMAYSCNPVFARVGQRLGADNIIEFAGRLGFANQQIIGYPVKPDPRQDFSRLKEPYSIVNSSIGQGPVLTTPVQITAMTSAIARGGVFKKPRLVQEILDSNYQTERMFLADEGTRAISTGTSETIKKMFEGVTTFGTGKMAYVPGWGSAGKTGSAQVNKQQGIVDAWFTGYAPIDKPKYAVTVLIKEGDSGGLNAAPVFRQVMQTILELPE